MDITLEEGTYKFCYVRNTESAPDMGSRFGQDIEPKGIYINLMSECGSSVPEGWETGTVTFENPLVLDWVGTGHGGWKSDLSAMFDNKTGQKLTNAIVEQGFDGVITIEDGESMECVVFYEDMMNLDVPEHNPSPDIPYTIFHTIRIRDLEKIENLSALEDQGYLVAPSLGITKRKSIMTKFGEIVFLAEKFQLRGKKWTIYERDTWTPKMNHIPEKLYLYDPSKEAQKIFRNHSRIRRFIEREVRSEYALSDPREHVRQMLLNESWFYDIMGDLAKKRGEYDSGGYPDVYGVADWLIAEAIPEVPKNKDNISKYFKTYFEELRGQDAFSYAYALASPQVAYDDLDSAADRLLLTEDDDFDFDHYRDEVQWNELAIVHEVVPKDGFHRDTQTVAGDLMKHGTYEGFVRGIREWGENPNDHSKTRLREIYELLRSSLIDVPSEYMEAKTLDPVSINTFYRVWLPREHPDLETRLRVLGFAGTIDWYDKDSGVPLENPARKFTGKRKLTIKPIR